MEVKKKSGDFAAGARTLAKKNSSYGSSLFFDHAVKYVTLAVDGVSLMAQFDLMQITTLLDSITIRYPIAYRVLGSKEQDDSLYSYVQLKFTRNNGNLFLQLNSDFCAQLLHYQLHSLLGIVLAHECGPISESQPGIQVTKENRYQHNVVLLFTHLNTIDEYISVSEQLSILAELTPVLYLKQNNEPLAAIINNILKEYTAVTFADYVTAIDMVRSCNHDELSPRICAALGMLKQRIPLVGAGRLIELATLTRFLQRLRAHEGARPSGDMWFPIGTVDKLAQLLEVFYLL